MTKTGNAPQHRNITITVVILTAVALAFFLASFAQTWQ
jgi:hypothetical protein